MSRFYCRKFCLSFLVLLMFIGCAGSKKASPEDSTQLYGGGKLTEIAGHYFVCWQDDEECVFVGFKNASGKMQLSEEGSDSNQANPQVVPIKIDDQFLSPQDSELFKIHQPYLRARPLFNNQNK